jgi:hypothetical protein
MSKVSAESRPAIHLQEQVGDLYVRQKCVSLTHQRWVLVQIAKKGRRADPDALGERESIACQIGPEFKLCTRT